MSTDQRASERVGELIHHAFESLLQANTDLERLQDLIGLEQRFRENWNKFITAVEGADLSASHQRAAVETVEPGSAPSPAITVRAPESATPVTQTKDVPESMVDPSRQPPAPSTPAEPTPVTVKQEPEQTRHRPPAGSVENPMEIDDSDDDETVVQGPVMTAKRRMKVPPPGGQTPGKRPKPVSNHPSGSKGPGSAATSRTQAIPSEAAGSSNKPSSSAGYKWQPHKDAKIENYGENRKLLHERLDHLGLPFNVDRSRLTHDKLIVTRTDIAAIYGGETVTSFPKIRKEAQARHPYRNFLHGNFDHNPFMPPEPGWPGLYFRLDEKNDHRDAERNPTVYRTFVRHADKRCVYLGQYTFTRLEDITKQEWRGLPDKTKTIWLRFFGDTLHGNRSLARIALRASLGKEPTEAQILAKCESIKPPGIRKVLAEKLRTDIRRAFNRGEERIVVWGMKCVSYDYEFESDLATEWQELDHSAPSQGNSNRRRRKIQPPMSDYSEDEDDDEFLMGGSREYLPRKTTHKKPSPHGGFASMATSGLEESSGDEEDLYHDADVGDILEYL